MHGPRKTLSDAYSAIIGIPDWTVCISSWLHHLLFGVRTDPADYKLVSFFCNRGGGLKCSTFHPSAANNLRYNLLYEFILDHFQRRQKNHCSLALVTFSVIVWSHFLICVRDYADAKIWWHATSCATLLYCGGTFWVAPPGHTQFFALRISWRRCIFSQQRI